MTRVCATPGCGGEARWIPIPEGNRRGSAGRYRCVVCCEAYPWVRVVKVLWPSTYTITCDSCDTRPPGVHDLAGAMAAADDHAAGHVADGLVCRRSG